MTLPQAHKPVWQTLWFALVVCGVVLGLTVVPGVYHWVQAADMQAAVKLNQMAGRNPVLDRFILLLADEDGRERIVLLVFTWFIIALLLAPGRVAKSRLLGRLLFFAVLLGGFFIVDAVLDDIFERRSPSYVLKPFHHIGKILKYEVDLTDRRSFPSTTGMIFFTLGFLLLRLKNIRGGAVLLALGFTLPLLLCVAGLTWVSDVYLGALPISFLLSALALETPFSRFMGVCIDLAAAAVDQVERFLRSIGPMWKHRKLYWASQDVFHMEVATKRFISKEMAGLLQPDSASGAPVKVEVPLGGLRSVIRIVSLGGKRAVLRAYPVSRRQEAEQHSGASHLLAGHGVRVPEILYEVKNPARYGAIFILEEFIDGESRKPADLTDADIVSAATELARLHSITSEVWGPIEQPRTEEFGNVLLRRIERQLTIVEKGPILKGQQTRIAEVRNWFAQWRGDLNAIRRFSLVHGKLHRENCLFETTGRFCLLDITTLEWGIPSTDLALVHQSQCGSDARLIARFDEAYYAALPPDAVARARHFAPLFTAVYCLGQISKYTKRLGRSQKRQVGDAITKGTHWWHKLLEIVEDPAGGEETK